jgi:hypothetical protein
LHVVQMASRRVLNSPWRDTTVISTYWVITQQHTGNILVSA